MDKVGIVFGYGLMPAYLWYVLATLYLRKRVGLVLPKKWFWAGLVLDALLVGVSSTLLDRVLVGWIRSVVFLIITPVLITGFTLGVGKNQDLFMPLDVDEMPNKNRGAGDAAITRMNRKQRRAKAQRRR